MSTKAETPSDLDSAWEGLASGELSPEEQALLRALSDESETAAVHYEAYAPLDASFITRTTDKLHANLERQRRSRRLRTIGGAASVVLAAAAAVLLFAIPQEGKLGAYSLDVREGTANVRGKTTKTDVVYYDQNSQLVLIAQPEQRADANVVASWLLLVAGKPTHVPARVEVAKSGAVRIELAGKDLPSAPGSALTVLVLVDRKVQPDDEVIALHRQGDTRVLETRLKHVSSGDAQR